MSDDVYRRAGRGGAGNYYSKKDIAEVDKRVKEQQDVESQKPVPEDLPPSDPADPPTTSTAASASSSAAYARSGRGGAGNFVDPAQEAATGAPDIQGVSSTAASAASAANTPPLSTSSAAGALRYSGRGGAGNFSHFNPSAAPVVDEEQERKRKETLEAGILKEIQDSLPEPPRTYHMHSGGTGNGKERAKGPDV